MGKTASKTPVNETHQGSISGSVTLSGEIQDDGTGTISITYLNYNDGDGMTLDGSATVDIHKYDLINDIPTEMSMEAAILTSKGADFDVSFSGTILFETVLVSNTETITANIDIRDDVRGETSRYENFVVVSTFNDYLSPSALQESETETGRVYAEKEGYVDVSTDSLLQYSVDSQDNPDSGGPVLLTGANGSQARVIPISVSKVRIEVDAGGDGNFELANVYLWTDLSGNPALNEPPTVGTLTIQPGTPHAEDYLTANLSSASDPDGDVLTFIYTWSKNGIVITGQTTETLAAGQFFKGDVISVSISVSDGSHTVTVEAPSVTILDTPPTISASPPAITLYGQPLNFTVIAADVDNDPVTFAILYGPNGMQIGSGGEVTWTPSGPMFEESLDVHFGIRVESGGAAVNYDGTMTVTDPTHRPPLVRTGIVVPSRTDGIRIADFDGDGVPEILVTDNRHTLNTLVLDQRTNSYIQNWVYPFDIASGTLITAIEAHDVNGDGHPDMIVGTGAGIVILDGVTRTIIGRIDDGYADHRSIHVADIDNDGRLEIVYLGMNDIYYSNQQKINVYDASDLTQKWQSALLDLGSSLAVGNVDGDSALELVTANGYVFDGVTHIPEWTYGPGFGFLVDTGDLDNDGVDEIVGAVDWRAVRVYSAVLKSPLWEIPKGDIGALLVANIDNDPDAEILVGEDQWGNVTAYKGSNGTGVEQWTIDSHGWGVTNIVVGDPDGDGRLEFVWDGQLLVVAGVNPSIEVEWASSPSVFGVGGAVTNPFRLYGPFVGGRWLKTGAFEKRAMFSAAASISPWQGGGSRLVAVDPSTTQVKVSSEIGSNPQGGSAVDGTDYDGDGVDEAFLATANVYDGFFTAYDFAADRSEWTSASQSFTTGRAVTHADLNEDLHDDLIAVTGDGYIYAYDVWGSRVLWKSTQLPGSGGYDLAVVDLDGDDVLEIIAVSADTVTVYEKCASRCPLTPDIYILRWSETLTGVKNIAVGDIDGDGRPEIVASSWDYYGTPRSTIWVYDGDTFARKTNYTVPGSITDLSVEQTVAGRKNLFVSIVESTFNYSYAPPGRLLVLDPLSGIEVWRSPVLIGTVQLNSLTFADTDQNGTLELILGTSEAMYVTQ